MTSEAIRDPMVDHLLTPQNSALVIIDYQPTQLNSLRSKGSEVIVRNIVRTAQTANAYGLPIVLSTVNVNTGVNGPTEKRLRAVLSDQSELDRTTVNAWEDVEFRAAVEATGRKKLIMAALWTEVCLVFPALDAIRDGFDVYPVVDAVAGTSVEAHEAGLRRLEQAGAKAVSVTQLVCELQRDWARSATVPFFKDLLVAIEADDAPSVAMSE